MEWCLSSTYRGLAHDLVSLYQLYHLQFLQNQTCLYVPGAWYGYSRHRLPGYSLVDQQTSASCDWPGTFCIVTESRCSHSRLWLWVVRYWRPRYNTLHPFSFCSVIATCETLINKNQFPVISCNPLSSPSSAYLQLGIVRPAPFFIKHNSVTSFMLSTVVSLGTMTLVSAMVSMYSSGSSFRFRDTSSSTSPMNISA